MSQSFASLFRASSFASLDAAGNQALTAPPAARAVGNWGLKHDLPKNTATRYVKINKHDHPWTKAPDYKSASGKVMLLRRWKELMPPVTSEPEARAHALASFARDTDAGPDAEKDLPPTGRDLSKMSADEWNATAKKARELAGTRRKAPWFELLDVQESSSFYGSSSPKAVPIHPPSYRIDSSSNKEDQVIVKGRILNHLNVKTSFSVAVAGIVAYLPSIDRNSVLGSSTSADRGSLEDFVVRRAEFDEFGRPQVVLGTVPVTDVIADISKAKPTMDSPSLFSSNASSFESLGKIQRPLSPNITDASASGGIMELLSKLKGNSGNRVKGFGERTWKSGDKASGSRDDDS